MAQANPGGNTSGVPPAAGVRAAVQSAHGSLVALYDADGRVHYVPEAQTDDYLRLGYSRDEHRVEDAYEEMRGSFDRAQSAVDQLLQEVTSNGAIGREAGLATAETAIAELVQGFAQLRNALVVRHSFTEPPPVEIDDPETGARVQVDPNQADGKSHAVRAVITPKDHPNMWPEPMRRAAGLISSVPPHLAHPDDPFSYAPAHDAAENPSGFALEGTKLARARRDAAREETPPEDTAPAEEQQS